MDLDLDEVLFVRPWALLLIHRQIHTMSIASDITCCTFTARPVPKFVQLAGQLSKRDFQRQTLPLYILIHFYSVSFPFI